jgi:hypothetical protein
MILWSAPKPVAALAGPDGVPGREPEVVVPGGVLGAL